jgi:hypothetical protein
VALAAVAVSLAAGCRSSTSRVIERVVVADTDARAQFQRFGIAETDIAAAAIQGLVTGAGFLPPDAQAPEGAERRLVRVVLDQATAVASAPGGAAGARVAITLELSGARGGSPIRESAVGEAALRQGEPGVGGAFTRAMREAAAQAGRNVGQRLAGGGKPDEQLVRELQAEDSRVRERAQRELADRRHPAAVPGLIEQLAGADDRAAERAIGALAEIGDRRAVMPLIELAHRRGGRDLAQIARIVADLGGPEARAWLDTVAIGHEDAEVRAAATEALAELVSREGGKMVGSAR